MRPPGSISWGWHSHRPHERNLDTSGFAGLPFPAGSVLQVPDRPTVGGRALGRPSCLPEVFVGLPFPSECHCENDLQDLARRLRESWGCHSRLGRGGHPIRRGVAGLREAAAPSTGSCRPMPARQDIGTFVGLPFRNYRLSFRHLGEVTIDGPFGAGPVCPASGRRSWGCHSRPTD